MFEPMSLIEGYLKEFIERLTKIEEAQKKNPRVKDEERRKEEEKARVALERNKEFESFTENFKEKNGVKAEVIAENPKGR
jgi:2,3-bisphosphoglycerate-independent phosphoglycerate mutase